MKVNHPYVFKETDMSEHTVTGSDANFDAEVLQSPIPVLVDFWAGWCAPCRMIAPVVDKIAADSKGKLKVVKVDIDANMASAERYSVMSIPTLMLFKAGKAVETVVGVRSESDLVKVIAPHL
jgi:thioredoxin 1